MRLSTENIYSNYIQQISLKYFVKESARPRPLTRSCWPLVLRTSTFVRCGLFVTSFIRAHPNNTDNNTAASWVVIKTQWDNFHKAHSECLINVTVLRAAITELILWDGHRTLQMGENEPHVYQSFNSLISKELLKSVGKEQPSGKVANRYKETVYGKGNVSDF